MLAAVGFVFNPTAEISLPQIKKKIYILLCACEPPRTRTVSIFSKNIYIETGAVGFHPTVPVPRHWPCAAELRRRAPGSDGKHPQIQIRSEWNCQPDKSRDFSFSLGRAQGRSKQNQLPRSTPPATKERRKRKRTRPLKNIEEVESQRLTHITVERNRRRQMNDHLNELRCLLPPSYVHRGEQASIIGGAIEFVKALEHLLQSLQAQKRMRQKSEENGDASSNSCSSSSSSSNLFNLFGKSQEDGIFAAEPEGRIEDFTAENRSSMADIEAVVIHNHANVKIKCRKRCGQLVKAILALEELRLTVLHLNIISYESFVHYSFNLQKEDDCQLKSADMIVGAVYHIFSLINGC